MRALVTGGGGFLGGAIVRLLQDRGDEVVSFSRGDYPSLTRRGVSCYRGDLTDRPALHRAAQGCDVVFHVAAKASIWGSYRSFHATNVIGTENVIRVCQELGARLVYTSSPSVVYDGTDQEGIDESTPYPDRYLATYPQTKALAERAVRRAASEGLLTVALRPHLIWGPEDNHLVPRIIERARAGQLKLVGEGSRLVDSVYIDNAAEAHLLAADRLEEGSPIQGQAYFITNEEPLPMGELINRILAAASLPSLTATISPRLAFFVGTVLEGVYTVLARSDEPRMTRFLARQLSTAHYFDGSAARRDLGYAPLVSVDDGMERLGAWLARRELQVS